MAGEDQDRQTIFKEGRHHHAGVNLPLAATLTLSDMVIRSGTVKIGTVAVIIMQQSVIGTRRL